MATVIETTAPTDRVYTTADLLALPDDGISRWLIDGRLVEVGTTPHDKHHSRIECRVNYLLGNWLDAQPEPRGSAYSGEAGVQLRPDPELTVGLDVVYLSPEVAARNESDEESTIIVGIPTLAVEILSPNDTVGATFSRGKILLGAGIPVVWLIDPYMQTVTILRSGQSTVVLNDQQTLDGHPELPGFSVPVARIFQH